ncbi:MAG: hypothetical protein ACJA1R_001807, partial [Flavobacteriales bacterium]
RREDDPARSAKRSIVERFGERAEPEEESVPNRAAKQLGFDAHFSARRTGANDSATPP